MTEEEKFDPLSSPVDQSTIPHLWDIAYRARLYLIKRTLMKFEVRRRLSKDG